MKNSFSKLEEKEKIRIYFEAWHNRPFGKLNSNDNTDTYEIIKRDKYNILWDEYPILQIKRIKDNEIFSIGDKIDCENHFEYLQCILIDKSKKKSILLTNSKYEEYENGLNLDNAKKWTKQKG